MSGVQRTGSLPPTPHRTAASVQLVALSTSTLLAHPAPHGEDALGIPIGAVVTPALPPPPVPDLGNAAAASASAAAPSGLPMLLGEPEQCGHCGARHNIHCPSDLATGEWHCCLCLHLNRPAAHGSSVGSPPAGLQTEAVDWVSPVAAGAPPASAGLLSLLVDVAAGPTALEAAKGGLRRALLGLHGSTRVALLAFSSRSVAAYRLGAEAPLLSPRAAPKDALPLLVKSDVLPGDGEGLWPARVCAGVYQRPTHAHTKHQYPLGILATYPIPHFPLTPKTAYVDAATLAVLHPVLHTCELRECRHLLTTAIGSLRSHAGCSMSNNDQQQQQQQQQQRCLGAALEAALHLAMQLDKMQGGRGGTATSPEQQAMSRGAECERPSGHVVVVTAGPASSYAPGLARDSPRSEVGGAEGEGTAEGYFEELGRVASRLGVAVDVVAAEHAARALAPLSQLTGGIFALHAPPQDAGGSGSEEGSGGEGGMGGEGAAPGCGFEASVAAAAVRPAGLCCLMEVRSSSGLEVSEAFGALLPLCMGGRPTEEYAVWSGGRPFPEAWHNKRLSVYRTGDVG